MSAKRSNKRLWWAWLALTLLLCVTVAAAIAGLGNPQPGSTNLALRSLLLPGQTTHGHHQIELACNACHAKAFPSRDDVQGRCESCHAAELKAADDKHPKSKFTDPRNAERAALLDATYCVTCHVEHKPEITRGGGLTLPGDYCVICHKDLAKDRPSHAGMAFDTCTNSGCHSYHDNSATYEDFLIKHAGEGRMSATPAVAGRDFLEKLAELADYPADRYPVRELTAAEADHGDELRSTPAIQADWLGTAHARAGVNCSACHRGAGEADATWVEKPAEAVCVACHKEEQKGFLAGLHGMRKAQKLPPMTPGAARLPMKAKASHLELGCASCHAPHRYDTRRAAVEACQGCHADGHTRAYVASPHYSAWKKELAGQAPPGSGVSCATCHMPRTEFRTPDYVKRTLVQHNQSANLTPRIKMARSACLSCHGLGFTLDALAAPELAADNYRSAPVTHVKSIEMAVARERQAAQRRAASESSSPTDQP